jgi:hypothetical protein
LAGFKLNNQEVILTIEMLLDDQSWFPYLRGRNRQFLYNTITEAQIKVIDKYYAIQDERALRTLYTLQDNVFDGDQITQSVLYPRTLILYKSLDQDIPFVARFVPNDIFNNYDLHWKNEFPKTAVYTLNKTIVAGNVVDIINYNDMFYGDFYYLKRPPEFNAVSRPKVYETLTLPPEYHLEICCLAAELINDLDVNEQDRGEPVYQNQRLTLKDTI